MSRGDRNASTGDFELDQINNIISIAYDPSLDGLFCCDGFGDEKQGIRLGWIVFRAGSFWYSLYNFATDQDMVGD